jgi:hypothetical protein
MIRLISGFLAHALDPGDGEKPFSLGKKRPVRRRAVAAEFPASNNTAAR